MPIFEAVPLIYKALAGHSVGVYYSLTEPVLMIMEPELAKEVLVKAFDHFVDRTGGEMLEVINKVSQVNKLC